MGAGPESLIGAGLSDQLAARGSRARRVDIEPAFGDWQSELRTGFAVQREVAGATATAVQHGAFPILLAGDCNSCLGVVAGLQATGVAPGCLWCDAHADFHTPETDDFGSLDCHGLSMLTGRAWRELVGQSGLKPLHDSQVALVGARAVDPAEEVALADSGIHRLSVAEARQPGTRVAVLDRLGASGAEGLHVHIDADVLDPSIAPANDYAQPEGLLHEELIGLVSDSATRLRLTSLSVASYDPALDPDGDLAASLVRLVADVIAA